MAVINNKLSAKLELTTSSNSSIGYVAQDGIPYKQTKANFLKEDRQRITNLELNQYSGVIVVQLFADLPVTGVEGVSYKVANDPDSNLLGFWAWTGATYVKDATLSPLIGYDLIFSTTDFDNLITSDVPSGKWLIINNVTLSQNETLPTGTTLESNGGVIDGVFTLTGDQSKIIYNGSALFGLTVTIAGVWVNPFTPFLFGAKGDATTDDTLPIQKCIDTCLLVGANMELVGNFLSDTITFGAGEINLYTQCSIQTINDVDGVVFDGCFVKHTGTFTHRGIEVSRETGTRNILMTGTFPAGSKFSKFDTLFLSQASIGLDYEAAGNNNGITWNYIQCREHSRTGRSAYTKGAQVSASNIFNIGIITTPAAIETRMGHIIILNKAYPIVAHPTLALTYYVGDFANLPEYVVDPENELWHYTGGGIIHQRWADNGAIDYKTINMVSLDGASITVQSQYGVTVNGGEIEGNATSVVVGGIYMNGANPESILHIRSMFIGLHTEVNVAQEPLVYTLAKSNVTFGGSLMANGVRCSGPEGGVRFHSWRGSDRLSNVYFAEKSVTTPAEILLFSPTNPEFVIYRDLSVAPSLNVELNNLAPDMEYMGDIRVEYVVKGELYLLNIPEGETRQVVIDAGGFEAPNTINGGAQSILSITGTAGKTIHKIIFLMQGANFLTFLEEDGVQTPLVVNESLTVNGPIVVNPPHVAGEAQRFTTTEALGSLYVSWKKTGDVLKGSFGYSSVVDDDLYFVNGEDARIRLGTNTRLNDFIIEANGDVEIPNGSLILKEYLVANLPAAGTLGRMAFVTDATAPTYLGTLTGGGAVKCPVFDNGVAWVSH